jgi:DNA-binding GntR family transcriptional regulator
VTERYREAVAGIGRLDDTGDPELLRREIVNVNDVFHDDVSRSSGNPWIVELIQRSRSVYFNYEMARLYSQDELLQAFSDHDRILAAISRGDGDEAEQISRLHVEQGFQILRDRMI